MQKIETYRVERTKEEAPGITTLTFSGGEGYAPAFSPGQYITVFFPDTRTPEGKAYSISSAPHERFFDITVRAIGEFSNRLAALQVGDTIAGTLPYGFFAPESEDAGLVMLASGIGITPFRSIIQATLQAAPDRVLHLFHTVRTHDDAIFADEFKALEAAHPFTCRRFVTREEGGPYSMHSGRITAAHVIETLEAGGEYEFLLCGSISFTRDMWRDLKHHGIAEDRIYTEAFFNS